MSVTMRLRNTCVEFTYEIENAEPVKLHYGTARFRPARAFVTINFGAWQSVRVTGPNVKKDGSDGNNAHENTYYSNWPRDEPDWLRSLADEAGRRYAAMAEAVRDA